MRSCPMFSAIPLVRQHSLRTHRVTNSMRHCVCSVQVVVHDISILNEGIRVFIIWILQLIIVHSLCWRRGFSFRFPLVLFVCAAAMLPFLSFDPGEMERARVDLTVQGGLTHPGGIAEWFGFFSVYFAVRGIENKRLRSQLGLWAISVGCLFVSLLAVSRSILFAVALAVTVASRRLSDAALYLVWC